jgi:hypothetical protein
MLNTRTVWNGAFGDVVAAFLGAAPLLSDSGALVALTQGGLIPRDYPKDNVFREKVFFNCAIEGIQ